MNPSLDDAGKLLLRVTLGVLVLLHGIAKIFGGPAFVIGLLEKLGLPGELGYAVFIGEGIAPLLMIFGAFTRIAALLVAANMVVAVLLVHVDKLLVLDKTGGWALELEGMFFLTALAVALLGPGRYSIDGR
jgi:putative oxidoreductase